MTGFTDLLFLLVNVYFPFVCVFAFCLRFLFSLVLYGFGCALVVFAYGLVVLISVFWWLLAVFVVWCCFACYCALVVVFALL